MPKSYGSSTESKSSSTQALQKKKSNQETNLDGKLATLYDVLTQPSHTQQSISKICGDIKTIIDSGTSICQLVVDQLITAICSLKQTGYHYGYAPQPLPEIILTTITTLFSQNEIIISDEIVSALCSVNMCDVFGAVLKSGIKLGTVYQTKQIIARVNASDFDKAGEVKSGWGCLLVNYADSFVYNIEILLLACSKKLKHIISVCINKKIQVTQECLYAIISIGDTSLVKLAILSGAKYDENALEYSCKIQNVELVKLMLSNKIKPTTQCVNAILNSHTSNIYNQKHVSTAKSELIALLVSFGYKITYDDIISATKAHVELSNFKSFGIKLDEKFIEICAQYGFYPYENCGIKPNARCLQLECNKSGNLPMIKKLVGMGIKPDITCLEYACKIKSNIQTIKFLIEKGNLKPNLQCLYNCSTTHYNKTLSMITDEYIIGVSSKKELENIKRQQHKVDIGGKLVDYSDEEKEDIDEDISNSDVDVLDYGKDEEDIVEVIPVKKAIKKTPIVPSPKKPTKKTLGKKIKTTVVKVESDDEIEVDIVEDIVEEPIEKKPTKKTLGKKKLQKEEPENSILPEKKKSQKAEPNKVIKTIDSVVIPEDYNYRETKKIPSKIITAFGLGKTDSLSFINLRKQIMLYVVQKNLIKDNMLNLDDKLQQLIDCQYTCVDSKYIDKLIYLMIS